jgi:hypothetical protein
VERTAEFFDSWLKSQEKAIDAWEETSQQLGRFLARQGFAGSGEIRGASVDAPVQGLSDLNSAWMRLMGSYVNVYDSWLNTMGALTETASQVPRFPPDHAEEKEASEGLPGTEVPDMYEAWDTLLGSFIRKKSPDVVRNTALRVFSSSHAYAQLYEASLPLFKAIREGAHDVNSHDGLVDPCKYKEIMDWLFASGLGSATEVSVMAGRLLKALGLTDPRQARSEAGIGERRRSAALFGGRFDSIADAMNDMFRTFDGAFSAPFSASTAEKDRERSALLLALCDRLSVYMSRVTAYQRLIYATGLEAMDRVIGVVAGRNDEGGRIESFDDFFNLWMEVSEESYHGLFATEEFAKLHGELLDSALNVRVLSFRVMESCLGDSPFVLRSETDDLYRMIHDLKKEVRAFRKEGREPVLKQ